MKRLILLFLVIFTLSIPSKIFAQKKESLPNDYKRNVIKWNLTPFLLWSQNNINLSYERVLAPYRTFSVNAGYFELPINGLLSGLDFKSTRKHGGLSLSVDYRFYFKKKNLNMAPDGVYFGPYASFHYYRFQNDIQVIDRPDIQANLQLDATLKILSAGVQLGYQFVIKDRVTIDLIFMGPSLSAYMGKIYLDGEVTIEEQGEYLEKIRDILFDKFPGLDKLVDKPIVKVSGATTTMGFGLRYMIQLGYRF